MMNTGIRGWISRSRMEASPPPISTTQLGDLIQATLAKP
jgi:hypothetical protein